MAGAEARAQGRMLLSNGGRGRGRAGAEAGTGKGRGKDEPMDVSSESEKVTSKEDTDMQEWRLLRCLQRAPNSES